MPQWATPTIYGYEWSNTDKHTHITSHGSHLYNFQPFFVSKVSLAISGSTWGVLPMMRTVLLVFFLWYPMPIKCPRKGLHHGQAASISWETAASLPRYSAGASEPPNPSRCQMVLWSLQYSLHLWIYCVARADGKTALLPSHPHVALGPKATALRLWISQTKKIASFHFCLRLFPKQKSNPPPGT